MSKAINKSNLALIIDKDENNIAKLIGDTIPILSLIHI